MTEEESGEQNISGEAWAYWERQEEARGGELGVSPFVKTVFSSTWDDVKSAEWVRGTKSLGKESIKNGADGVFSVFQAIGMLFVFVTFPVTVPGMLFVSNAFDKYKAYKQYQIYLRQKDEVDDEQM